MLHESDPVNVDECDVKEVIVIDDDEEDENEVHKQTKFILILKKKF